MLTPRWQPMLMHPERRRLLTSPALHRIAAGGRRSGKTEDAKRIILAGDAHHRGVLDPPDVPNPRFGIFGPTREQLKRNWWDDIKAMSPQWAVASVSEVELSIHYITGAKLYLIGLDKHQRAEGDPFDGVVTDETQEIKPKAWESSLYPTLTNRGRPPGWSLRIGRPKGRNHFYTWWTEAKTTPDADAFHWPSSVVLPVEKLEAAKAMLDPLSYQQEYEAAWVNFEGVAYYQWGAADHYRALEYDPNKPLVFCFDFNVDPGVAAVLQEQLLPGETENRTCVIGEVHIPRNSNTPAVCRRLVADWKHHEGDVFYYGDASGGARHTSQTDGSDWDLVRQVLRPVFGERLRNRVPRKNPAVRDRLNAANSRLKSTSGVVRFAVDPQKAPHVVRDFEGVTLLQGGSGEIDKRGCEAQGLTHLTDAIGYYINERFPIRERETVIY